MRYLLMLLVLSFGAQAQYYESPFDRNKGEYRIKDYIRGNDRDRWKQNLRIKRLEDQQYMDNWKTRQRLRKLERDRY